MSEIVREIVRLFSAFITSLHPCIPIRSIGS